MSESIHWIAVSLGVPSLAPCKGTSVCYFALRSTLWLTRALFSDSPDYGFVPMNEHLPQYAKAEL